MGGRLGRRERDALSGPSSLSARSYPGSAGPPDLAGFIGCPFRSPPDRIGDPTVDVGFPPSRAVGADLELGRKRALGDLAVDGGPGQAGAVADGVKADDTVWLAHGNNASCWLFLTVSETSQSKELSLHKKDLAVVGLWRTIGGK
ncbi:conserved hypothetical protein [Hyphomicrobium sp. GJ21]|nr:conserved hypothetical protein [Hyphomicrobium sp. GJ21]